MKYRKYLPQRERDKRNELSRKYNRGVNVIGVIDNCLDVTAIGLDITGVGLLSTIVAASAVIEMEVVTIVMGLLELQEIELLKRYRWKQKNMTRMRC